MNNYPKYVFTMTNSLSLVFCMAYGSDEHVYYWFSNEPGRRFRRKIYYTSKGDPYFNASIGRVRFDACMQLEG